KAIKGKEKHIEIRAFFNFDYGAEARQPLLPVNHLVGADGGIKTCEHLPDPDLLTINANAQALQINIASERSRLASGRVRKYGKKRLIEQIAIIIELLHFKHDITVGHVDKR